jgi:drug/metabolite transporter (DMT)-like permease
MLLNFLITNFGGELAALGAAFLWALSAVIYAHLGQKILPLALNLSKDVIAIAFIALTLIVQGNYLPTDMNALSLGFLLLSGVLGIGLGDTFYFEALNHLGARRTLLLEALAPPLSALIALIFLQETLSTGAWVGIFLTVLGVSWVISERVAGSDRKAVNPMILLANSENLTPQPPSLEGKGELDTPLLRGEGSDPSSIRQRYHPIRGVSFALVSALGQASGAVLSRAALAETAISPLWSTLLRLIGGVLLLLLWIPLQKQPYFGFKPLQSKQLLGIITITALFSTYLGILLQQTALKYTATGIAQSLLATSPLFVLPIAIGMGEVVSPRAFLGVLVALGGIGLLFGNH